LLLFAISVADHSLKGDYGEIRKGDCIVAFSRNDLYSIKAEVERLTPHKCCMIYGQLPPETRSMQARLFNDENTGFDVLVASDAIGMGLNLNIRRIIFHTTMKRGGKIADKDGDKGVWLHPSFVKQIAGRAGRLSSNYDFGEVTSWQEHDLAYIRAALSVDVPQLTHAGIFPSVEQMEEFSEHVKRSNDGIPVTNLAILMKSFVEAAQLDGGRYILSDHDDMTLISNWLNTIPLSLRDRYENLKNLN
jgi:ATP-dependent RNA helicase SUPV3L1/SUV3